jgi:hypothetical protein
LDGACVAEHSGGRVAPDRRSGVDVIREAARLAVEATSLRAVARAIGMSPMGLKHFLAGTRPYRATERKLIAWYVVYQTESGGFSIETVRSSLEVLTEGIPIAQRERAQGRLLDEVRGVHEALGTRPPGWLRLLLDERENG